MVGVFPMLELPSGNAHRGLGTGHTHAFLPLWIQKGFGQWTAYGGGGYGVNTGDGNKNYWFTGAVLQRKITEHLLLGGELFHQTSVAEAMKDQTGFNLGGVYDFTDNYHLLFSAGRGLQNASATNEFSYYVAFQMTF